VLLPDGYIKRKTSTIPYGYEFDSLTGMLRPIEEQLVALSVAEIMVRDEEISLRDAADWLHVKTGRYISHVGLKQHVDKLVENEIE
tara:strand:- start:413 stop:670 length:258 start_codon:yes stop_codon:yes gene_type:complete